MLGASVRTSWLDASMALALSYVLGQLLAWVYELTYDGLSYSRKFADTLTLLTSISCAFVLLAQRSLLAGLGLVAVVSLVRFRASVKAPHDLVFIMGSATFGLGAGLLAIEVTLAAFVAFCAFALFLSRDSLGSRRRFDGVLRLRCAADEQDGGALDAIFSRHCSRSVLLSASGGAGEPVERSYQVKFKRDSAREALLQDLTSSRGVRDVRLLLEELNLEY
jgi:hypothetical protein